METASTPFVALKIDEQNIVEGAKAILRVIRPKWCIEGIKFKFFSEGITNKLVGCWYSGNSINHASKDNVLLIRIYGNNTDLLIDRAAETRNITLLQNCGFAPQLYATFQNGIVYEYVEGRTLTPESVTSANIWPLIAIQMAKMHKVRIGNGEGDSKPMLLEKCRLFFELLPAVYNSVAKQDLRTKLFPTTAELRQEFDVLYAHLETLGNQLVFCHNDLLLGNIIHSETADKITFIDYEYAALNFQAFDIGNHFTEYAGIDNIDYTRYPDKSYQLDWLRVYLETFESRPVTDEEIDRLYVHVQKFALASHFVWFLWALIQAEHSTIDFDFLRFGEQRFNEYRARKVAFMALTTSP